MGKDEKDCYFKFEDQNCRSTPCWMETPKGKKQENAAQRIQMWHFRPSYKLEVELSRFASLPKG